MFVVRRRTSGLARLYPGGLKEITDVSISPSNWNYAPRPNPYDKYLGRSDKYGDQFKPVPGAPNGDEVFRRLAALKSVTTIDVWMDNTSATELALLCKLPRLKKLRLSNIAPDSGNAALEAISSASQLCELSIDFGLNDQPLTEKGFACLNRLQNLQRLTIKNAVMAEGALRLLRSPEELDFIQCSKASDETSLPEGGTTEPVSHNAE